MAIQDKNGIIRGKAGSVIYRNWRGLNVIQGIPRKVKQTLGSQASAAEFGRASATAANLRKTIEGFYLQGDLGMNNRLTKQVLRALQGSPEKERLDRDIHDADLNQLKGFQFNSNSSLGEALPVIPEVVIGEEGKASIRIPAFERKDIAYRGEYRGDKYYKLRLMAIAFDFRKGFAEILSLEDFMIERKQAAIQWNLEATAPEGCILMLGVALYAVQHTKDGYMILNSTQWSPAALVGLCHVAASKPTATNSEESAEQENNEQAARNWCTLSHDSNKAYPEKLRKAYREYLKMKYPIRERPWDSPEMKTGRVLIDIVN